MAQGVYTWNKDFLLWIPSKSETEIFLILEGPPLWIFQEIWKIAISFTDLGKKSFLDQFLILYSVGVQKISTFCPFNFVRVDQSLQLDVLVYFL